MVKLGFCICVKYRFDRCVIRIPGPFVRMVQVQRMWINILQNEVAPVEKVMKVFRIAENEDYASTESRC